MASGTEVLRTAEEKCYRVKELANLWSTSSTTITRMFKDDPDVIRKPGPRGLRTTLFIPACSVLRVRESLAHKPLQSLNTSPGPFGVVSLGDLHARVAKKPRNVLKLHASKKLAHSKGVAKPMGPTV